MFYMMKKKRKMNITTNKIINSRYWIKKLKEMGIQVMMLTGDNRKIAAYDSKELDLDDFFAEVLSHEKA